MYRPRSRPARRRASACALLALAVFAPAAGAARPQPYRGALLRAINTARIEFHLAPLQLEPHLALAARRYSRVLARTAQISHDALGSDMQARLAAAGYRGHFFGENLA